MKQTPPLFTYEKIAEDLRTRIKRREFENGKLTPERDLAENYKVNRLTLRKAMNLLENEKLIFRDGARGTFIGKRRNPKAREGLIVGFVLVGRSEIDPIHSVTMMELEKRLRASKSHMMLFCVSEENEVESELAPAARDGLLDAIVFTGLVTPKIAAKLADLGLPAVLLGHLLYQSPIEASFDSVCPDSVAYSCAAVKHLLVKGHRRVGLINGPGYQWFLNIYQGYMKALDESELPYDEALVRKCDFDAPDDGMKAMRKLLAEETPTAVFIASERLAAGASRFLKDNAGGSNTEIEIITVGAKNSATPEMENLQTVVISWRDMVNTAVELLLRRVNNPETPPKHLDAPFTIE